MKKSKFYFTFGSDPRYPYRGGWVEVIAEDMAQAVELFKERHPNRVDGMLNCAFYYSEDKFCEIGMKNDGNFGAFCHEVIGEEKVL